MRYFAKLIIACLLTQTIAQGIEPEVHYPYTLPASGNVALVLHGGVRHDGRDKDIQVDLALRVDGTWDEEVWGYANLWNNLGHRPRALNISDNVGRLVSAEGKDGRYTLRVSMRVEGDRWIRGGQAEWTIDVRRDGDEFIGSFNGTYAGAKIEGKATGQYAQLVEDIPGFIPPEPGEHPRLLFRKADIPELRRRMNTPEGKAIIAQLDRALAREYEFNRGPSGREPGYHAAGWAFKYVLTGDKKYADKARELTDAIMRFGNAQQAPMQEMRRGGLYSGVALAFDMCHDAWDEAFRETCVRWIEREAQRFDQHNAGNNPTPHSNHHAGGAGNQGLLAMAILDEPGFFPDPPRKPADAILAPQPIDGPAPEGVPVSPFKPGKVPANWLYVGPFPEDPHDWKTDITDSAAARPKPGEKVTHGSVTHAWKTLPAKLGKGRIDFVSVIEKKQHQRVSFYTLLKVDKAGTYRAEPGHWYNRIYLGGIELTNRSVVDLKPGLYPMLVPVIVGNPTGAARPRLVAADRKAAQERIDQVQADYKQAKARYDAAYARWVEGGKRVRTAERSLKAAQRDVRRWLIQGVGKAGFFTELDNYYRSTLRTGILPFTQAWAHTRGKRYADDKLGVEYMLPLLVAKMIGAPGQEIVGPGNSDFDDYSIERSGVLMMGFPTVKDEWQPYLKGWFDKRFGIEGSKRFELYSPDTPIYAMVNYPWGMRSKSLDEDFPHAFADVGRGYYLLRRSYDDVNDVALEYYLRSQPLDASWQYMHPNLGVTTDLWGWGHHLLRIPLPSTKNDWLGGVTTLAEVYKDGSATITADTSLAYGLHKNKKYTPRAVTASRSLAVDYSGKSGAPVMIALVDQVKGEKGKLVTRINRTARARKGDNAVEANRFTLDLGPTKAHGVVVTDGEVEGEGGLSVKHNGTSFIIFTVGGENAPKFDIKGKGLSAVIRVGDQTVRYDGKAIRLSKHAARMEFPE